jgi:hypothetical protein
MRGVLALATLAPLPATGCIVADAPEYGSPQRSSIFIYQPVPPNPGSLQLLTRDQEPKPYGATVRSEDAAEQIVALYFVDYKHTSERLLASYFMPPYTFEQERTISRSLTPSRDFVGLANGCHTITLVVTHYSSWDQDSQKVVGPPEDTAGVTWFVSVDDDGSALLSKCPSASNETP